MTYEQFKNNIFNELQNCPKSWRKGQAVFNIVDELFGVARIVQFEDGVDCFYNDDAIDNFLHCAWQHLTQGNNNKKPI